MSPRRHSTVLLMATSLLLAAQVRAQDLRYTVEPEASQVAVGQPFQVVCRISASSEIEDIELPDLGELLQLGSSRSEGSQVTISNGQLNVARQITIVLSLQAEQPGRYTLGPGSARAGGQRVQSRAVIVEARGQARAGSSPAPATTPPSSEPLPQQGTQGFEKVFVALAVDQAQVVLGQQITATLTLYSRVDLSDIQNVRLPDFQGVVVEELDAPRRVSGRPVLLDRKRYQAYRLRSLALFPTQAGLLQLPPASVVAVVGGGFFNAGQRAQLESEPVEVEVLPLPVEGRPPGFEPGNVGDYALEVTLSSRTLTLRDPLTVKVAVVGSGNLRAVTAPPLTAVDGFRVYQPTPFEDLQIGDGTVRGRRGYEVLLQPQRPGQLTLPSLVFAFYDPVQRQYRSARSDAIVVEVTGVAASETAGLDDAATAASATLLAARPVRLSPASATPARPWSRSVMMSMLFGLPALAVILVWADGARRRRHASRTLQRQRERVRARRAVLEGAGRLNADALAREVEHYLELVLGQPVRGLTREGLDQLLVQCGVDGDHAHQVHAFGAAAEASRFAPPDLRGQDDLATRARALVDVVEQCLRDQESRP
ncbi:MAG: BatD family protein [Pseudomonadota bacterium]